MSTGDELPGEQAYGWDDPTENGDIGECDDEVLALMAATPLQQTEEEVFAFMATTPSEEWEDAVCFPVVERLAIRFFKRKLWGRYEDSAGLAANDTYFTLWKSRRGVSRGDCPRQFRNYVFSIANSRTIDVLRSFEGRKPSQRPEKVAMHEDADRVQAPLDHHGRPANKNLNHLAAADVAVTFFEMCARSLKGINLHAFRFVFKWALGPPDLDPFEEVEPYEKVERLETLVNTLFGQRINTSIYDQYAKSADIGLGTAKRRMKTLRNQLRSKQDELVNLLSGTESCNS